MMINKMTIQNFRGLTNISINLAPFTLIAGANNVGKTSVLEALFLLYGHRSPLVFNQILSFRNVFAPNAEAYDLWENVFNNYDVNKKLIISTMRDTNHESLMIVNDGDYDLSQAIARFPRDVKLPTSSLDSAYPLRVSYKYNDKETRFHLAINANAEGVSILSSDINRTASATNSENLPVVSFSSDRLQNPAYLYELLGKVNRSKQKDRVVSALKGIDNRINDIILGDKQQIYIDIEGLTEAIPLSFLGAGITNVLYWSSLIVSDSAKILLIDEIENGIHYTSMQPVMEKLCEIGHKHGCQIIATTHSIDCVNSFSKCPEERIGYARLDRHPETGAVSAVEIEPGRLPKMLEAEWEVR